MKKICAFIIVLSISFAILNAATLEDIQKLASQGKYAEAVSAAESILQQKPGNINALRWIAYLNYKLGNFDSVIALDAQNLSDAEISNIIGLSYMAKNNYSEAEKAFNKAVVYDKKFPDAFINKAEIYIINKDFKNAKECLKTANYINNNDFRTLYKLGYVNIQLGEYSNAVANYLKASAINPKDESVFINLGYAYFYNKDYKNALNSFNKAAEIRKDSKEANLGLAVTYASMKNYKEAEKYYSDLLKTENNYNNNFNMGFVQKEQAKFKDALLYFQKANELMPSDADSLAEIGWCKYKTGDKEGAEQSLNQALSLNQDNISTLSYLGIIYSVTGKNNEAYATWSRCVLLNPKNADFKLRLGDACVNIDKYDEAINSYKDALSLNKKLTDANFGIAYAKLKKAISGEKTDRVLLEEALAAFKDITVSEPKNDLAWTNIGVCYFKLNRYNDASLAYKKALSINPKNTEAQKNSAELDKVMKN